MVILDVETLDLFADVAHLPHAEQYAAMRFGLATVWHATTGRWVQYWSSAVPHWKDCVAHPHDIGVDAIVQADDVVDRVWRALCADGVVAGWNVRAFDLAYLRVHVQQRQSAALQCDVTRVIDLFDAIRVASRQATGNARWYRLDVIADATLGRRKRFDGAIASRHLASGDPNLVREAARYCREDVALCADLATASVTTGLYCPPRPERGEQGMLRVVLNQHGEVVSVEHVTDRPNRSHGRS